MLVCDDEERFVRLYVWGSEDNFMELVSPSTCTQVQETELSSHQACIAGEQAPLPTKPSHQTPNGLEDRTTI